MKRKCVFIYLSFLMLFLLVSTSASAELLVEESYFDRVHEYLREADESILVVMYFIIIDSDDSGPVSVLVADLIDAANRGVDVRVVLEDSRSKASRTAYERLENNGIAVFFDTPSNLMHVKGVTIDDRYLFIGSANWSDAALLKNYEASYLVDSPDTVAEFKKYVETIPVSLGKYFISPQEGVPLSSDFLLSLSQGRRLLKAQGDKQLDLYLLLCKMQDAIDKSDFEIDYDSIAKELGYTAPEKLGKYRNVHHYYYERVHRVLKKLRKYGLIEYRKGRVVLKSNNQDSKDKSAITIPYDYWSKGYARTLSMRAKYLYLICLYEANRSTRYPVWFRSQEDMAEIYGISDTTISLGLLELEKAGLLEITRDPPTAPNYSDRNANIYKII